MITWTWRYRRPVWESWIWTAWKRIWPQAQKTPQPLPQQLPTPRTRTLEREIIMVRKQYGISYILLEKAPTVYYIFEKLAKVKFQCEITIDLKMEADWYFDYFDYVSQYSTCYLVLLGGGDNCAILDFSQRHLTGHSWTYLRNFWFCRIYFRAKLPPRTAKTVFANPFGLTIPKW